MIQHQKQWLLPDVHLPQGLVQFLPPRLLLEQAVELLLQPLPAVRRRRVPEFLQTLVVFSDRIACPVEGRSFTVEKRDQPSHMTFTVNPAQRVEQPEHLELRGVIADQCEIPVETA